MTISSYYPRDSLVVGRKWHGKTYCDGDAFPPKSQRSEEGRLGPSGYHQAGTKGGKTYVNHVPSVGSPRPSLWNDPSFNMVEFIGHCLPFMENFPDDYWSRHNKSSFYLMRLSEA